ncbi:YncE family protein [Amycolatopsis anabasis]|uniref:YncE family protein n=1 Tax=Amycolatopsis anabasis TaxID=1840409 RepID=UPI00131D3304|nr:hypothetical protein [Amycolatopsis anabasis]
MNSAIHRQRRSFGAAVVLAAVALVAACGPAAAIAPATGAGKSAPGCQTTAPPPQATLNNVRAASLTVPAAPFGLAYARSGRTAFVALRTELGVLATDTFPPRLVRTIPLPAESLGKSGATGLALTHNGSSLLVATGRGAIVLDAAKAEVGMPGAVLGTLTGTVGTSAIAVTVSPDDRFVFVSQEYGNAQTGGRGAIEVFDLRTALGGGFGPGTVVGSVALGKAVVGSAISSDGRWLYATSQLTPDGTGGQGQLGVLDLTKLETNPSGALLRNVPAGCNPVRVAPAPDGKTVWVTARGSNALLTSVQVGSAPVGLTFTRDGARIVTADSNRFDTPGATTGLTVVDTRAALAGKPANLGRIPTGTLPRELAPSPDGTTLLATNFGSRQIQALDTTTLP